MFVKLGEFDRIIKMLNDAYKEGNVMAYHALDRTADAGSFDYIKSEQDVIDWNNTHKQGWKYELFDTRLLVMIMLLIKRGKTNIRDYVLNDPTDGALLINVQDLYLLRFLPNWLLEQFKTLDLKTMRQTGDYPLDMQDIDYIMQRLASIPAGKPVARLLWETHLPEKYFQMPDYLTENAPTKTAEKTDPLYYWQLVARHRKKAGQSPKSPKRKPKQ